MTTRRTAPEYIDRDTYEGKWTRSGIPAGMRVSEFTAAELAELAPEGVLWTSFGHLSGREQFGRSRYVAAAGNLHVYDQAGRKIIVHPAARTLRVLAR
jgi:hypothetical protein